MVKKKPRPNAQARRAKPRPAWRDVGRAGSNGSSEACRSLRDQSVCLIFGKGKRAHRYPHVGVHPHFARYFQRVGPSSRPPVRRFGRSLIPPGPRLASQSKASGPAATTTRRQRFGHGHSQYKSSANASTTRKREQHVFPPSHVRRARPTFGMRTDGSPRLHAEQEEVVRARGHPALSVSPYPPSHSSRADHANGCRRRHGPPTSRPS